MPASLGRRAVRQSAAGSLAAGTASSGFTPRASVEWTAAVGDGAQVRVVGNTAAVAGRDLLAVDVGDSTERWRVEGDNRVRPEAVGGDAVFVERDGDLLAYAAATGRHRWTLADARTATCRDGAVVGVTRSGRVVAVDAADGRERWSADIDATPLGSPAVAADRVYVGDGRLSGYDAATGVERWRIDTGGVGWPRPAGDAVYVADGVIYLGTRDGRVMALSAPDPPPSSLRRLTPRHWPVGWPSLARSPPSPTADSARRHSHLLD
jgi:outer membrane protein assembly factor BamB